MGPPWYAKLQDMLAAADGVSRAPTAIPTATPRDQSVHPTTDTTGDTQHNLKTGDAA